VLPLNVTLVAQITLLFALTVFVAACLLTPIWPVPGPSLAWALVLIPLQAMFCFGLALLLATLQVFLRDTQQVTGVLVTVWMFLTPLFWIPQLMGVSIEPFLPWLQVNPVYHLVQAWRGTLMGDLRVHVARLDREEFLTSTAAIPEHVWHFALWALGAYVVGYAFFVLSQRRFADEV
jgi:ABC-type polysaccharide/polyol phosphate export permease